MLFSGHFLLLFFFPFFLSISYIGSYWLLLLLKMCYGSAMVFFKHRFLALCE